jgi:uncharacterized YigZ family protein
MILSDFYQTIEQSAEADYRDRGSKFIAYAFPLVSVQDFKDKLMGIKKLHPKATHHCFAYRIGLSQDNFRVNDDGEPSGSAGRPILGQIDSKSLTNCGVVVVRYFGGSLLGVPGLINAYKSATAMALQLTPIIRKPVEILYMLHFDYTQMNDVMMVLKQSECSIVGQQVQLFCDLEVGIPRSRLDEVLHRLQDIRGLEIKKKV